MRRLIGTFRAAGVRFSRDGCAFLAQALAYNAMFAMIPLGLLAIAVFGFVFGSQEGQDLVLSTIDDVAPALHDLLAENLTNAIAVRGISGAIALVALVWSGKNLFQALAFALNRALGVPAGRPWIHDIALSIVMLPLMGLLLLVSTFVPPAVTFVAHAGGFASPALAQVTVFGVSILLVFVVAATLYTFLPNRALPWNFGIPGAIFTAITWQIAQIAFTVFTAHANLFHLYGALSTVLALLLWFYLMGNIFLYGAELCAAELEERTPAAVEPKSG
ncbi:MAG: YihY/virulence factor BrkB family protein [Candidatus Eremiobacteraeota bacterium]|nr:YihY/virulence factor BrkB family protein [Candidatus Eremiobacteraeota bacterium]